LAAAVDNIVDDGGGRGEIVSLDDESWLLRLER
jgi:hypothetical protein